MTVYQEAHPERARTYRSVAEAFRTEEYACPYQHFKRPSLCARIYRAICGSVWA